MDRNWGHALKLISAGQGEGSPVKLFIAAISCERTFTHFSIASNGQGILWNVILCETPAVRHNAKVTGKIWCNTAQAKSGGRSLCSSCKEPKGTVGPGWGWAQRLRCHPKRRAGGTERQIQAVRDNSFKSYFPFRKSHWSLYCHTAPLQSNAACFFTKSRCCWRMNERP